MPNATIIGRVALKVIPDSSDFYGDAKRQLKAVEKKLDPIKIGFKADFDQAAREVRDAVNKAQKFAGDINIHADVSTPSKAKVRTELSLLTRPRVVEIVPNLNKAAAAKVAASLAALSGVRSVSNLATSFADWVGSLDKALPKIAGVSLGLTNLSSLLLTSTSNVLAFGSSLASIGGTFLALPGIFGGLAIGAGSAFAVLKDFNKVLPEVGRKFHDLQDSMSGRFWKIAEAPMRDLIESILPQFSQGLERTSTSLGRFFANLSSSAKNVFDGQLGSMFDDLNQSIEIAARYTTDFIGVIEKLGSVGAGNLPRLAKWFGDTARNFDGWLEDKGRNGLQEFVDQGITALQDLGGVLRYTGSTFAGLARAAERAGGSTLAIMRDTMKGVAETVNGFTFQRALARAFTGAHEGMSQISQRSGPEFEGFMLRLSRTLSKVLPSAGAAAGTALGAVFDALDQPKVQQSLVGFFESLETVMTNLSPSMPGVARALAGMVDVVAQLNANVSRALAPALDALSPAISGLAVDLEPLIDQLGDLLVHAVHGASPVLLDLAGVLGSVARAVATILAPVNGLLDLFDTLPGPIQSTVSALTSAGILVGGAMWFGAAVRAKIAAVGISLTTTARSAGIAQAALFRAGSAAQAVTTRMTGLRTGMAGAGLAVSTLGTQAAGSNQALGLLASAGGGALMGFAAGGPIGAAIGGSVGLLLGLATNASASGEAAKAAIPSWESFASTLNQVSGAATEATRSLVYDDLRKSGVLESMNAYGISSRTVIDGVLGQAKAREKLGAAIATERAEGKAYLAEAKRLLDANSGVLVGEDQARYKMLTELGEQQVANAKHLQAEIGLQKKAGAEIRAKSLAVHDYSDVLKGLPKRLITRVEQTGLNGSIQQVAKLTARYKLTPKKVKTLLEVAGVDASVAKVKKVAQNLKDTGKIKVEVPGFRKGVEKSAKEAGNAADKGGKRVKENLEKPAKAAKADLSKFQADVRSGTKTAEGIARSGGVAVGSNLKAGIIAGFAGTGAILAAQAASAVRSAISAARSAAKIKSPSRKMMEIGRYMGQGLTLGLKSQTGDVENASKRLASKILDRFLKSLDGKLTKLRQMAAKAMKEMSKGAASGLKDQLKRVKALSKEYRSQMGHLDKLRSKLKALNTEAKSYKTSVIAQIVGTGDPTRDGASSFEAIITMMKIARDEAIKFAEVMAALKKKRLNKDTFAQIVAAGPEAGLATAQAILESGAAGVSAINDIQSDIKDAAKDLGTTASASMFGAQIKQAEKDIKKLTKAIEPLQKKLEKLIKQMMASLANEVKKGNKQVNKELAKFGAGAPNGVSTTTKTAGKPSAKSSTSGGGLNAKSSVNVLNYYAQTGPSLSSEEALFAASKRGRMAFAAA